MLNSSFSFLYKTKFSLDVATASFPKCINNPPNYTTECLYVWLFEFNYDKVNDHLINHMLLIPKYCLYQNGQNGLLELKIFIRNICKIKTFEKQISLNKPENWNNFEQKWTPLLESTMYIFWNVWWSDS